MSENVIGDNIKRLRGERGLTQEQLAQRCEGRSVNQINGYERGRSRPSPRLIAIIAKALGVSAEDLTRPPSNDTRAAIRDAMAALKAMVAQETGASLSAIRVSVEIVQ
jgi:transcriptional regulator with XRE-family HTH domain